MSETIPQHQEQRVTAEFLVKPEDLQALGALATTEVEVGEVPEVSSSSPDSSSDSAPWHKIATFTREVNPYHNRGGAFVRRIPLSLPTRAVAEYDVNAIQYATGPEARQALELYGVDAAVVEEASQNDWNINTDELPQELKHTILTANMYEAMSRSHDPVLKRQATERNSHVTPEDIWQPSTLHHVTGIDKLKNILQDGQLGFTVDKDQDDVRTHGGAGFGVGNLNFGKPIRELGPGATYRQKIENLAYSQHGKAEVYIHYTRPEGCYREGEEYEGDNLVTLMSGGMPSTEISALTMRQPQATNEEFAKVRDAIVESECFVPVYTLEGELAYSRDDFEADMKAVESNTYVTVEMNRQREYDKLQELQRQQAELERTRIEREASEMGMSVEEYAKWQAEQPVAAPFI